LKLIYKNDYETPIVNDSGETYFVGDEAIEQFYEHYKRLIRIKEQNDKTNKFNKVIYEDSALTQMFKAGESL